MTEACAGIFVALLATGLGLLTTPLFPYKLEMYGAGLIFALSSFVCFASLKYI